MKTIVAMNPTRAVNIDDNEPCTSKIFPTPLVIMGVGGSSVSGFMQFKNTSELSTVAVEFPVALNSVMRGVMLVKYVREPTFGKVATLWTSYVVLLVGMQSPSCKADALSGPVIAS